MRPKITFRGMGLFIAFLIFMGNTIAQQLTHQFTFSTNDLEISEVDGYGQIALKDGGELNGTENAGKPQLPVKYFNLLLPAGSTATNVNITVGQETQLTGSFDIFPVQLPRSPNFEKPPPFVGQDPAIYGSNTPFPQSNLVNYKTYTYRDYNYVSIAFIPFKYLPLDQKLYFQIQVHTIINYT